MKMKIASALCGVLLMGGTLAAQAAEFSGNVTYATDYRFRGISQGDRSQALQGGFDLEFENGFYIGTWASNVGFTECCGSAGLEVDYYAGYGGELSETVGFDVSYLYYNYPEDDADPDLDYWEIAASISFYDATVGVNYSNDYFAETDTYYYLYGDYSFALAENVSLDLHLGWNIFDDEEAFASFILPAAGEDPGDDYIDYSVGISTSALGLDFGLQYIGTDIDEDECFGGTKLCDDTVVFSVSRSM